MHSQRRNWEQSPDFIKARICLILEHRLATTGQIDQRGRCGEHIITFTADHFHHILNRTLTLFDGDSYVALRALLHPLGNLYRHLIIG